MSEVGVTPSPPTTTSQPLSSTQVTSSHEPLRSWPVTNSHISTPSATISCKSTPPHTKIQASIVPATKHYTTTSPKPINSHTTTHPPHAAVALAALSRHEELTRNDTKDESDRIPVPHDKNKDTSSTTITTEPTTTAAPVPLTLKPHVVNPLKVKPFLP